MLNGPIIIFRSKDAIGPLAKCREVKMKDGEFERKVLQRLGVLISLRLDVPTSDRLPSIASKVVRLSGLGLSPSEVASILGKPTKYVTANLSKNRSRIKKRK